jgi:hypothetical protein
LVTVHCGLVNDDDDDDDDDDVDDDTTTTTNNNNLIEIHRYGLCIWLIL